MNYPYGPWATLIFAGQNPQLSVFWRRRMTMLAAVSHASPSFSRQNVALLIAAASCAFLLYCGYYRPCHRQIKLPLGNRHAS
jgi:hypothetical protein